MAITLREVTDRILWERFLLSQAMPPFLQSWQMRALHQRLGEVTVSYGIYDGAALVGLLLGIIIRARRGSLLTIPYGPVLLEPYWDQLPHLTAQLRSLADSHHVDVIRSSPFIEHTAAHAAVYRAAGWRRAPIHLLAEHVWWLDIRPSEEELLKGMRKTMRNLIRRAERDGVTIELVMDPSSVEQFISIHRDTVKRHHFVPYTDAYFRAEYDAFRAGNHAQLFQARYQGKIISSAMMITYGDTSSYHHGASLSEYQRIPASYLLQWAAIQEAKRRGCTRYNFWGVVPEEQFYSPVLHRAHPFIGVTTFKTGFGGQRLDLLPCQDYPLTARYWMLTRPIETVRRMKRGFSV